ncbi:2-hydroxyacyl-CoA dehydratase [Planctomycetota bacterium]
MRQLAYTADPCPMPALEMLIAEMLAIHFCSDLAECLGVLEGLLEEVRSRVQAGLGVLDKDAARVFWVNPVADLRVMNLLEACGGRICGTDYLFTHALEMIAEDVAPIQALARMVLADPMVGSTTDRAHQIRQAVSHFGAEAVVVSRIPGASHCAFEGQMIKQVMQEQGEVPMLEIEVPPLADAITPTLRTRLEALIETVRQRRTT